MLSLTMKCGLIYQAIRRYASTMSLLLHHNINGELEVFTFHVAGSLNRGNKHFTVHELPLKMGCILQGVAKIVLLVFYDHVHTLLDKFLSL